MSKWTAVNPDKKELHFIVSKLLKNEEDEIIGCTLEAVINKNCYEMAWKSLKDDGQWIMGWK